MIRHLAVQVEPAKPSVREVEMDLLAEPALGPDAEAVADDQHPDHELGIGRGPTDLAVKRPEMRAQT